MNKARSHLTVEELQLICNAFGLNDDGTKPELIKRIVDFVSSFANRSNESGVSRVSYSRTRIFPQQITQTSDFLLNQNIREQNVQSPSIVNEPTSRVINSRFNGLLTRFNFSSLIAALIIGFVGGCIFFQLFAGVENIEVPVKRSFFSWFS